MARIGTTCRSDHSALDTSVEVGCGADASGEIGPLAPIIAGARARGVADGFELAGVAALLLGSDGRILHIGSHAKAFLGKSLSIVCDHLVADAVVTNRAIERMLSDTLALRSGVRPVVLPSVDGAAVSLTAVALSDAVHDPMQLLKAVVILQNIRVATP